MRRVQVVLGANFGRCWLTTVAAVLVWATTLGAGGGLGLAQAVAQSDPERLPGTQPLTIEGDLASLMIDQLDAFLLQQLEQTPQLRDQHRLAEGQPLGYADWRQRQQNELQRMLGLVDQRADVQQLDVVATTEHSGLLAETPHTQIWQVRWPTVGDIQAEGLLLMPKDIAAIRGYVLAIPDADQTPAELAGLVAGKSSSGYALRLADAGCCVVIPSLLHRTLEPRMGSNTELTHREFIYRSAFELGRHLIGYEVAAIQGGLDFCVHHRQQHQPQTRIGLVGWGEGGMLGLYTAALDQRVDCLLVSGHFEARQSLWQQPLDRNVFGLLNWCGDAELAAMHSGTLLIEAAQGVELELPGRGGAPAVLTTPKPASVTAELARAAVLRKTFALPPPQLLAGPEGAPLQPLGEATLATFGRALISDFGDLPAVNELTQLQPTPEDKAVQQRLLHAYDRHNQRLLEESPLVRQAFMQQLDTSSLAAYERSTAAYRQKFAEQTIGRYPQPLSELNPRVRVAYDEPKWTGYDVMLDVYPGVFAYGVLLLPKDLKAGQRRPVVVCQHGLEGRPQDTITGDHRAYHDYAAKLAERGFITFAPQNPYIFQDRFRTLQRKSNPMGKTLFSLIVPQHQQIVNYLQTLPNVDPKRIAFYGLSYGGKTAMRVPALVTDYCLSICSADFNDWVWKNAATQDKYSYVRTGEYEIFEFDLGSTFSYAEMAALICPRPFMVERGHFDGVAPDERVAYEFAKVRNRYAAQLGIGERCEIEWFVGPHTINGQGTFDFLHRHLKWPQP